MYKFHFCSLLWFWVSTLVKPKPIIKTVGQNIFRTPLNVSTSTAAPLKTLTICGAVHKIIHPYKLQSEEAVTMVQPKTFVPLLEEHRGHGSEVRQSSKSQQPPILKHLATLNGFPSSQGDSSSGRYIKRLRHHSTTRASASTGKLSQHSFSSISTKLQTEAQRPSKSSLDDAVKDDTARMIKNLVQITQRYQSQSLFPHNDGHPTSCLNKLKAQSPITSMSLSPQKMRTLLPKSSWFLAMMSQLSSLLPAHASNTNAISSSFLKTHDFTSNISSLVTQQNKLFTTFENQVDRRSKTFQHVHNFHWSSTFTYRTSSNGHTMPYQGYITGRGKADKLKETTPINDSSSTEVSAIPQSSILAEPSNEASTAHHNSLVTLQCDEYSKSLLCLFLNNLNEGINSDPPQSLAPTIEASLKMPAVPEDFSNPTKKSPSATSATTMNLRTMSMLRSDPADRPGDSTTRRMMATTPQTTIQVVLSKGEPRFSKAVQTGVILATFALIVLLVGSIGTCWTSYCDPQRRSRQHGQARINPREAWALG